MKTRLLTVGLILFSTAAAWSRPVDPYAHGACPPDESTVIDAEAHCFKSGGVSINYDGDGSAKVACMQNKDVQRQCGQDGLMTRQQAFGQWYKKLQIFQSKCAADGGSFAFQDSKFKEPQNESFCLEAQPEVNTSMFEDSLCNYRSVCPAVTVVCTYGCGTSSALPDAQ